MLKPTGTLESFSQTTANGIDILNLLSQNIVFLSPADDLIKIIKKKKKDKYCLSRKSLENMYKSFVLPHFDYAEVVCDHCTNALTEDELESLHLDAMRTITGAVRGTIVTKNF